MKKYILICLMLLFICNTAFAEKEEWIDENYDFSVVKSVNVEYQINEDLCNGIREKESIKIFEEDFINPLKENCSKENIEIRNNLNNTTLENVDLMVKVYLDNYVVGESYSPGYSYTTVVPTTTTVYTGNGIATVTTNNTQVHSIAGGYVDTAFVTVRFDVIDVKTGVTVWSRIDDRNKKGDELTRPRPKKVFGRILKSFNRDFQKKLLGSQTVFLEEEIQ